MFHMEPSECRRDGYQTHGDRFRGARKRTDRMKKINAKLKPYFKAAMRDNGVLELTVYEEIGSDWFGEGVTAKTVKQQIDAAGPFNTVLVRINSPGGDAFEGVAVYNLLRSLGKPIETAV